MDGHGLSSKAHCECLSQNTKVTLYSCSFHSGKRFNCSIKPTRQSALVYKGGWAKSVVKHLKQGLALALQ